MTYHPIDKPTEPGWYWRRSPAGGKDFFEVFRVRHWADDPTERLIIEYPEDTEPVATSNWGTWYGPAIQPPALAPARP